MHYLGIDAGASATKWTLIDENDVVHAGVEDAMDGHIYRKASKDRMESVLQEISKKITGKKVASIYLGITGVLHDGSIEKQLEKTFNAPNTVVSDIELAYRANFTNGSGILLYAGTGSVAYAIDEENEIHKIGGWGYLLGDEGAGYWIGRESIRHSIFQIEDKKSLANNSLAGLVMAAMKAHDWDSVKAFVYSNERSAIAAMSSIVDASANNGDKDAIKILEEAAAHLAELVNRIDNNLARKSLPVKLAGGISGSTLLYKELAKLLRQRISVSTVDIAHRAAELAR